MRIENGKIYQDRMPLCEGTDVFEIVEKIPANYFVWNIGENMGTDEYIPLVHDLHPEDKDEYTINRNTMKAIKLPRLFISYSSLYLSIASPLLPCHLGHLHSIMHLHACQHFFVF